MAGRERDDGKPSDEQRITALEEATDFNRKLLMIILGLTVLVASIAVALGIVRMIRPPSSYVEAATFTQLQQEVKSVLSTNKQWQKKIDTLSFELNSSQASAFKTLLLEQEQSYQLHLAALKNGMRDIANMVPGSRTWLDIYNEQMDAALSQSRARMKKLESIQTSEQAPLDAISLPKPIEPVLITPDN